ncbi:MAG: hypothetical protein AVO34_06865 [Firmicutes bacterium ML8_F2]|jgi:hypothetical protein|nr:MAG: hypothetical protein AVO34_06865 [Firmicutes bacterium ML8_F2]
MVHVEAPFYHAERLETYKENLDILIESYQNISLKQFLKSQYLPMEFWRRSPMFSSRGREEKKPATQPQPRLVELPREKGKIVAVLYEDTDDLFSIVHDMIGYKTTAYFWEALRQICPNYQFDVPSKKQEYPEHIKQALNTEKINLVSVETDYLKMPLLPKKKIQQAMAEVNLDKGSFSYFISGPNTEKIISAINDLGVTTLTPRNCADTEESRTYSFGDHASILVDSEGYVVGRRLYPYVFSTVEEIESFIKENKIPTTIRLTFPYSRYHSLSAELNASKAHSKEIVIQHKKDYTVEGLKKLGESLGIEKFKKTKPQIEKQIADHILANPEVPVDEPLMRHDHGGYHRLPDQKGEKIILDIKQSLHLSARTIGNLFYHPEHQPQSLSLGNGITYRARYCDVLDFRE